MDSQQRSWTTASHSCREAVASGQTGRFQVFGIPISSQYLKADNRRLEYT